MHSNKKRMAGDDKFQSDLKNAQAQNNPEDDKAYAGGTPGFYDEGFEDKTPEVKDQPRKDPQAFLNERTSDIARRNRETREEIANDPERTKERISGIDRSKFDFSGYSDADIARAMQGDEFGEKDYARLTGKSASGGSSGSSEGGSGIHNAVKNENEMKYGGYGSIGYNGPTFAQKAIDAAAKSNPVDFKALDQRIHDRPLYTQAMADIKHSETFGDTWSWDSAPKWNMDRFKSEPIENRYADVMDKDDDD